MGGGEVDVQTRWGMFLRGRREHSVSVFANRERMVTVIVSVCAAFGLTVSEAGEHVSAAEWNARDGKFRVCAARQVQHSNRHAMFVVSGVHNRPL